MDLIMTKAQSLALLATTAEARQTYGLRHDDFQRYRSFCSRRVQRLRVASGLKQQVPVNDPQPAPADAKPKATSSSKKKKQPKTKYEAKPISSETATDLRHVRTLVFTTERYWAYANDLLEQAKVADPTSANQKRRHALKKLKLAAATARSLESIVTDLARQSSSLSSSSSAKSLSFHPTDILEVRAYAATMQGRYLIELRQWQPALDAYLAAKAAYLAVMQVCADADPTHAALCQAAIDSLDPHVRFAMYSLTKLGVHVNADTPDLDSQQDALAHLIELSSRRAAGGSGGSGAGDEDDVLQSQLDALLSAAGPATSTAASGPSLTFLGTKYGLRASTPLGQLVAQLHDLAHTAAKLPAGSKQQLAAYQSLVSMALQAEKLAEKDVASNQAAALKVATSTTGAQATRVQAIAAACAYARRVYSVQRNMILIKEKLAGSNATAAAHVGDSLTPSVGTASVKGMAGSTGKKSRVAKGAKNAKSSAPTTKASATASAATDEKKRFADAIRLLDLTLANLAELADMPVLASHPLATQLVARARAQFDAHRMLVIAHVYTANKQWALARAAALRGVEYLGQAESLAEHLHANDQQEEAWMRPEMPCPLNMHAIRAELIARAGALTTAEQVLAKHVARDHGLVPMNVAPFATSYATAPGVVPVARCVPIPVPAKPVFFDLAFAEIEFPELHDSPVEEAKEAHREVKAETPQQPAAAGAKAVVGGKKERMQKKAERQLREQQAREMQEEEEKQQQASSGLSGWLGGLWGGR
ncbi:hypothetical protein BCR44DRAFT_45719 [Catenaria anguillulae PL171]|uniref:Signal recognition particle subunit SRP68 n=1 Tax=Catenaria anguillulae PL171 TaxID=765915 RepID=A0A1Y2HTD0_9FUNG|nr:hypothetical protein BCR44DRAFT_45719 [Catenaria anguillulae PL171]